MNRRQHPAQWADTGERCRAAWCRDCTAPILRGLDADFCAFMAYVDPHPLSAIGEALALVDHRDTYDLEPKNSGYALTRRGASAIKHRPAGRSSVARQWDVVAQHRCHSPALPQAPTNLTQQTAKEITDGPAPF